ncbi:MAG: PAAR-like domain-containing protein [Pseudomonadota bacterium]
MVSSVNCNNLSVCHKGSIGITMATIPDVCKTPAPPGPPVPIPYPNIAFSAQLAKGTKKVKVQKQMTAIKGSEFAMSTGDEPGTLGGVKSGVFKNKATWILYSPNVKMEGKNVCRLTDKMFMNKMNTVSMGGEMQNPLPPGAIKDILCEYACNCKDATFFQRCVARQVEADNYTGNYPDPDAGMWREVHMTQDANGDWGVLMNRAGTGPSARWMTPRGGIRPDIVTTDGAGNPTAMIEMKGPGDRLNANQSPGGKYDDAADSMDIEYQQLDVTDEEDGCPCWNDDDDDDADNTSTVLTAAAVVGVVALAAVAVATAPVTVPAGAVSAAVGGVAILGAGAVMTQSGPATSGGI